MSIEKLKGNVPINQLRLSLLEQLFPEAFGDGKLNLEILGEILHPDGEANDPSKEHFGLFWPGKSEARRIASKPSAGTLTPLPTEGVNENATENIFIKGDNLEVLKLLQKSYANSIKMIYIDPPYNTGQDLIYKDDYSEPLEEYLKRTKQKGEEGELLTTNAKADGRFHSSWLSMMYPRLRLAWNLLSEHGWIFVSIDDNEVHNLREIMNEVFGEDNFVSEIVIQSNKRGQTYKEISKTHEYLLLYAKEDVAQLFELVKLGEALPYNDSKGDFDLWELRNRNPKFGRHNRPNLFYPIYVAPSILDESGYAKISLERSAEHSEEVLPRNSEGKDSCWRWGKDKVRGNDLTSDTPVIVARRKRNGEWNIYEKSRKSTTKAKSIWNETAMISEQGTIELGELGLANYFDHPKPVALIKKALQIATEDGDLILDFFAGSGTTAQAVLELNEEEGTNRHFILVQLPELTHKPKFETIAEVTAERIRRVINKLDEKRNTKLQMPEDERDRGFRVFELSPSNFKTWRDSNEGNVNNLETLLSAFETPLVESWSEPGVLSEILLLEGFPLTSRVSQADDFANNRVLQVDSEFINHRLFVCLEPHIRPETIEHLSVLSDDDIFICLDAALDDTAKVRLHDVGNVHVI